MGIKSIKDIDIRGKRVFFRFDFNVPLDKDGTIKDDTRIRRALPTIRYAVSQGARSILASHLGRPKGEVRPEMSLRPIAARLTELLGQNVRFIDDCIGEKVKEAVSLLRDGEVLVLENLRFHAGETKNDPEFAAQLAAGVDVYVNDAFGTAHRAHASTVGVAGLVGERAAGLLLKEELDNLEKALEAPRKPVVAILGGAKISDKLGILTYILNRMDSIVIGGGMANTFLNAQGMEMGRSLVEHDLMETAREILQAAKEKGCAILLPVDFVVAPDMKEGARTEIVDAGAVPEDEMALDIGPRTIDRFRESVAGAGTILWNGPMGVFEIDAFKNGTVELAKAVANSSAFTIVGGGDSVRALYQAGVADRISYISTGGGAFLEFLEGKTLPGVAALAQ
ncbi:MAG: phosphoglycerate kinase [Thermodesulfobacteriota bacterium]